MESIFELGPILVRLQSSTSTQDLFVIISHFGERDDAMVLHILRSAHALRALRTCRLFKGLRVLLRLERLEVVEL